MRFASCFSLFCCHSVGIENVVEELRSFVGLSLNNNAVIMKYISDDKFSSQKFDVINVQ